MSDVSDVNKPQEDLNPTPISSGEGSSVSVEPHKRLLAQRKRDQEKARELEEQLAHFQDQERQRQEAKLEEKGEYQKILEERENRIKALESQMEDDRNRRVRMEKESAFRNALSQHGKLRKDEYLQFVDFDSIAVDSESGKVDQGTLQHVLDGFVHEHGALLESVPQPQKIPNKSPPDPQKIYSNQNQDISPEDMLRQAIEKQ